MQRPREVRRGPKGPTALYLALTVVMVVLIASLAFSASQPPPPQIAQLTPQAQHQITRAPNQLSSSLGSALGGPGAPGAGATTTTRPAAAPSTLPTGQAPIDVAAAHHCYGNPPMQISFDTQSPPCVAYWAGNNGGATSRGVTASEVRVVVYTYFAQNDANRLMDDLKTFFNRYFEFYGRQLEFLPGPSDGGSNCAAAQAQADDAVDQDRPFVTMDPYSSSDACYFSESVRDHLLAVSTGEFAFYSESRMADAAPYLWEYPMSYDREEENIGQFVCTQLAGKRAAFSPDPQIASQTRRFGLIMDYDFTPYPYSSTPLIGELAKCGVHLAAMDTYEDQEQGGTQSDQAQAAFDTKAVLDMETNHVTTVLCLCLDGQIREMPAAADAQHYYPEWLLTMGDDDWNVVPTVDWPDADQRKALMGMTFFPRQEAYPDATVNEALATVDPGFQIDSWSYELVVAQIAYWNLLAIASGIQLAGPDLTPYTFQRGLQDARFPNPSSPAFEGAVGFGGGSHAMTTDAAVMWWSDSAVSMYPGDQGTWCYVDGGRRFHLGTWSTTNMALFQGPCQ